MFSFSFSEGLPSQQWAVNGIVWRVAKGGGHLLHTDRMGREEEHTHKRPTQRQEGKARKRHSHWFSGVCALGPNAHTPQSAGHSR